MKAKNLIIPTKFTFEATKELPNQYGYKVVKIKQSSVNSNVFNIKRFNNYVTEQYVRLTFLPNGFSFAKIITKQNYRMPSYSTEYFDNEGNRVQGTDVLHCRKKWLQRQKNSEKTLA